MRGSLVLLKDRKLLLEGPERNFPSRFRHTQPTCLSPRQFVSQQADREGMCVAPGIVRRARQLAARQTQEDAGLTPGGSSAVSVCGAPAQRDAQGNHAQAKHEVEPVV